VIIDLRVPLFFSTFSFARTVVGVVALSSLGSGAALSIPSQPANAGQLIASSVTFSTEGAAISGLQFDLEWEEGLEVQVATGNQLRNAVKSIYTAPLTARSLRVLIVGMNRNNIGDGELVRLFVAVNAAGGSPQIKMSNQLGVSDTGDAVAIRASAATIRIDPTLAAVPLLAESVLSGASLLPGPIAPGEIVTVLGAFGVDANSSSTIAATVNQVSATVLYALGNQVNAVVPFSIDPANPAVLELHSPNRQLGRITLPVVAASPAIFTQGGAGIGPGAILNQDFSVNSPANPARANSIVMIYGTGFGPLAAPSAGRQTGLSTTVRPVTARIAGAAADVTYAGAAPGLPDGVVQINVQVPGAAGSGDALALSISSGTISIPDGVSLAVR
jgi:uncharacterized protein (TIGR03437 family)